MLGISKLTITRSGGGLLVRGLDIAIGRGEILAVVGRSGVGKSSLLNVIAGFVPRSEGNAARSPWQWFDSEDELTYAGTVLIDGHGIDHLPVEQRRAISFVMQGGVVYEHLSVLKNVTFPLRARGLRRERLRAAALELLDEVELYDNLPPEQRDAALKSKAGNLSGGERQRLALARALAKEPRVLLLDEAFANLDSRLRTMLFERSVALIKGQERCAVVITHDFSELKSVDSVLLLGHDHDECGHRTYRRQPDGSMKVEQCSGGETSYWRDWHELILAAA